MTTESEFRSELSRLYADALKKGFDSYDLAEAAEVDRSSIVKWIGGYDSPLTSEARENVLAAVSTRLLVEE